MNRAETIAQIERELALIDDTALDVVKSTIEDARGHRAVGS